MTKSGFMKVIATAAIAVLITGGTSAAFAADGHDDGRTKSDSELVQIGQRRDPSALENLTDEDAERLVELGTETRQVESTSLKLVSVDGAAPTSAEKVAFAMAPESFDVANASTGAAVTAATTCLVRTRSITSYGPVSNALWSHTISVNYCHNYSTISSQSVSTSGNVHWVGWNYSENMSKTSYYNAARNAGYNWLQNHFYYGLFDFGQHVYPCLRMQIGANNRTDVNWGTACGW